MNPIHEVQDGCNSHFLASKIEIASNNGTPNWMSMPSSMEERTCFFCIYLKFFLGFFVFHSTVECYQQIFPRDPFAIYSKRYHLHIPYQLKNNRFLNAV